MTPIKPGVLPAWSVAAFGVIAFAAYGFTAGKSPWLILGAQLWLAYMLCWTALVAVQRWAPPRSWPAWVGLTLVLAALAAALLLPLSYDFTPERLRSWQWAASRALPPMLFALLFLLPGMLNDWRIQQKQLRQLALAEQRRAVAELSKQVTLAELKSLQAQVEPHFLYNTLAGVQYLVRRNAPLADQMLEHLITYLRRAVPSMRSQSSTVQAECELVRAYLEIMKLRLGERLQAHVACSAEASALAMPPMMLATLVENAIKHGIEPKPQGGRVDVSAEVDGSDLLVRVRDTGAGLPAADAQAGSSGSGTGLANTADRLRTLFGNQASLSVESAPGGGVVASLRIPRTGGIQP